MFGRSHNKLGPVPGANITAKLNTCAFYLLIFVCIVVGLGLLCTGTIPVN